MTRRVVVAFDSFAPDPGALRLALRLAVSESQSLHALYVEDTDTLTLGSYPWAQEITLATAESRPLPTAAIERMYSGRAAEARSLFEALAGDIQSATFETVRGRVADELRRIAADASGVLLDWPSASRRSSQRAMTIIRALLDLPAALAGVIGPGGGAATSAILLAPGEDATGQARALLGRLAAPAGARLVALQGPVSADAIIQRARAERAGTILVQRGRATDDVDVLARLALDWTGSVLFIRSGV